MRLAGEGTAVDSGNLQYAPTRSIDDRLHETSALAVVIDTFEQRVQRCNDRDVADYSGKKEQHTLKSARVRAVAGLVNRQHSHSRLANFAG